MSTRYEMIWKACVLLLLAVIAWGQLTQLELSRQLPRQIGAIESDVSDVKESFEQTHTDLDQVHDDLDQLDTDISDLWYQAEMK